MDVLSYYEFELSEVLNMKVLFLDIDGVLNCMGCKVKTPSGFKFVETVFLERVKKIVDETGCVVVLSSTWRNGFYDLQRGIENSVDARDYILLKDKLSEYGVEIYSHTPELREYHRGTEILEWLYGTEEEVDAFVILDDDTEVYPLHDNLVRTYFDGGLQDEHVKMAIEMLNRVFE